jgi:hypothetical protein
MYFNKGFSEEIYGRLAQIAGQELLFFTAKEPEREVEKSTAHWPIRYIP